MSLYICQTHSMSSSKMNPKVSYKLWVIIKYHCRFINYILQIMHSVRDVSNEGTYMSRSGSIWEISILSIQFCSKPKTAVKK